VDKNDIYPRPSRTARRAHALAVAALVVALLALVLVLVSMLLGD
jgi:hypothetical protein